MIVFGAFSSSKWQSIVKIAQLSGVHCILVVMCLGFKSSVSLFCSLQTLGIWNELIPSRFRWIMSCSYVYFQDICCYFSLLLLISYNIILWNLQFLVHIASLHSVTYLVVTKIAKNTSCSTWYLFFQCVKIDLWRLYLMTAVKIDSEHFRVASRKLEG